MNKTCLENYPHKNTSVPSACNIWNLDGMLNDSKSYMILLVLDFDYLFTSVKTLNFCLYFQNEIPEEEFIRPIPPGANIGVSLATAGLMFGATAASATSRDESHMDVWATTLSGKGPFIYYVSKEGEWVGQAKCLHTFAYMVAGCVKANAYVSKIQEIIRKKTCLSSVQLLMRHNF